MTAVAKDATTVNVVPANGMWITPESVKFTLPLRLVSVLNGSHGHWLKARIRRKEQRTCAALGTRSMLRGKAGPLVPCVVTITRIAPRPLDDDNLAASAKSVRDGIADALGSGDGPKDGITWRYAQAKGAPREYGVRVALEWP